jgi:hypothetical protein
MPRLIYKRPDLPRVLSIPHHDVIHLVSTVHLAFARKKEYDETGGR